MQIAPAHPREGERLGALRALRVLDTAPEERFDRLAQLAATVLEAPIALVSLIDRDRQWCKARVGTDLEQVSRNVAFCAHAIVGDGFVPFVVPDARRDLRFADNPYVIGEPGVRFYAGRVLADPSGLPLGTLCVIDTVPRKLTRAQASALDQLGALAEAELVGERHGADAVPAHGAAARTIAGGAFDAVAAEVGAASASLDALEQGVMLVDRHATVRRFNPAAERLLGRTAAELTELWATGRWLAFDEQWNPLVGLDRPLVRAGLGEPIRGEVVGWERPDGVRLLLRLSCVIDVDGQGSMLVTFTDVTEERRLLQDLSRFRHFFDNADDMIAVIGADGCVQYASPSTGRVLGYPAGWRHPQGILGLVHPDDLPQASRELGLLIAGARGPDPLTVRVRSYAGDWHHVECVGVNLLDEPAVQGVVLTFRDATERVRLTRQLEHLASHDPLTDLPNRSVLEPRIERALAPAHGRGVHVGLCFIDLDGFKAVNDHLGHAAGDRILVEVADRIRSVIRPEDTAVRIGGDEFVVVLDPVWDASDARLAAERIGEALAVPELVEGGHRVGASIGVAISSPGDEPSALLQRADGALYRAKATAGSTIVVATPAGQGDDADLSPCG